SYIFLWTILELTLRTRRPRLIGPLAIAVAALMFSPTYDDIWLSGLTSLHGGISSLAAATILWLMARWPRSRAAVAGSLLLSAMGILNLPCGAVVWGIVLAAVTTQSLVRRNVEWQSLIGRLFAVFLLSGAVLTAWGATAARPHFLNRPFEVSLLSFAY